MRAQDDPDDIHAIVAIMVLVRIADHDRLLELGAGRFRAQDEIGPVMVEPLAGELMQIVPIALDDYDVA